MHERPRMRDRALACARVVRTPFPSSADRWPSHLGNVAGDLIQRDTAFLQPSRSVIGRPRRGARATIASKRRRDRGRSRLGRGIGSFMTAYIVAGITVASKQRPPP